MNKLVEALEFYANGDYHFDSFSEEAKELWEDNGEKAKQALAEYSASPSAPPTVPAPKTFTDEEGREWRLLDFGYGTASDLRLQLRLGAGLFDSQVIEVSRAEPTTPPTDEEIMAVQKSVNTVLNYTPERVVKLVIEAFLKMRK